VRREEPGPTTMRSAMQRRHRKKWPRSSRRAGGRVRRPLLLAVLAAALAWYAFPPRTIPDDAFATLALGGRAPRFHATLLAPGAIAPPALRGWEAGQPVALDEHRGMFVVLEFWATWCKPCAAVRPDVSLLARRYASRGVAVYGIAYRETAGRVLDWLARNGGADYPELQDEGWHMANAYSIHGVPQMYVIGPDGRLRWHCFGCDSLPERLYPALDSLLGRP